MSGVASSLVAVLNEANELLVRPGNDFSYSGWMNADDAQAEADKCIARLRSGERDFRRAELAILFAATGAVQEISLCSG